MIRTVERWRGHFKRQLDVSRTSFSPKNVGNREQH